MMSSASRLVLDVSDDISQEFQCKSRVSDYEDMEYTASSRVEGVETWGRSIS
jgi:hypothetical protein